MLSPNKIARHPLTGMSVLIVGAGVGGLMAAMECWRKGHEVRIVERGSGPDPSGDFFTIGPSAIQAFKNWPDLLEENEQISYNPLVSYHKQTGECVVSPSQMQLGLVEGSSKDELPKRIYRHHRPKFALMLARQLERIGIGIEYNHRVVDYLEDTELGKGAVLLENGGKLEADLIVAADGLGTKSHPVVNGQRIEARSSGYAIYRTAYPTEIAFTDPLVAERFKIPEPGHSCVELWAGPDMHLFVWNSGDLMSWLITHKDTGTAAESWHNRASIEDVLKMTAQVEGWPEVMDRLIKTTPKSDLVDWKLMWRDPQPKWHSPAGRVVQLGDCAHTFLPSSGNGGTQAIEDAISLATCLQIGGKSNIPLAIQIHNKLRFERVSCCQIMGVVNQNSYHNTDWDAVAKDPIAIKGRYGYWIWTHDAEKYAYENYGKALSHLLNGTPFHNTNIPPGHVYKPWTIDEMLASEKDGKRLELSGDWS